MEQTNYFSTLEEKEIKGMIENTITTFTSTELTFGQKLCGVNFNPSKDPRVDRVKEICAELADMIESDYASKTNHSYIYNLVKGKTLGSILETQMLSVKLITLKD